MSGDSSSEEEEFRGDSDEDAGEEEDEEDVKESSAPQSSDDEDDDDDKPIASLKKGSNQRSSPRRKAAKEPVKYDDADDDEDDEDDIPLAQLAKRKESKKPSAASNASTASTKKKKKAEPPKKKAKAEPAPAKTTSSSSSSKKFEFASAALYGTECLKGLLIQRLLCRWWYAIDWPKTNGSKPAAEYEPLDGFPGVYVCTSAANAGHILDTRDMNRCPSFQNFAKKDASELQTLLLAALQAQKRQLIQAEGAGTTTEQEIDKLIKWTNKLNPDKADKEAVKVLKASKITL